MSCGLNRTASTWHVDPLCGSIRSTCQSSCGPNEVDPLLRPHEANIWVHMNPDVDPILGPHRQIIGSTCLNK